MLSLEVLHVEKAQKAQIWEPLFILSNSLIDFKFSTIFWVISGILFKKEAKSNEINVRF